MASQHYFDQARGLIGKELGTGDWFLLTQEQVDRFADVTHDHQFIHVDPEKAALGQFGGTIAHGYFTLSLLPHLRDLQNERLLRIPHKTSINYGLNKVRFLTPVPIPSRIRLRTALIDAEQPAADVIRLYYGQTVEVEHSEKPALYAETISQLLL